MGVSFVCPCCHSKMTMTCLQFTGSKSRTNGDFYNLLYTKYEYGKQVEYKQYLYKCGNKDCNSLIIAVCRDNEDDIKVIYPRKPESFDFSSFENIQKISQNFINIFNDAYAVESLGYKEIAGPGYRKAMEYLIKDYALYLVGDNQKEKEKIIKEGIMDCITGYIEDSRFQELAKHTMWLGNDQVHYYQKWEDKDIEYLKGMIKTAMNYIEMQLKMQIYSNDFQP